MLCEKKLWKKLVPIGSPNQAAFSPVSTKMGDLMT
jgi:hypothetical protein